MMCLLLRLFRRWWILLEGWGYLIELRDSRKHEKEADIMSLYIQKRAGYDIRQWPQTINLLKTDDETYFDDHPRTEKRVEYIKQEIPQVEKAFKGEYVVEAKIKDVEKGVVYSVLDSIFQLYRLAFSFSVYSNKDIYKRIALSIITFPFSFTTRIRLPAS